MATHSSVLAWRIAGMAEPGGLPSMGSHRVGHDWSNLSAAAAAAVEDNYHLSLTCEPWLLCALDQTAPSPPLSQQETRLMQLAGTDTDMTSQHKGKHPQGRRQAGPWSRHALRTLPFLSQAESGVLTSWLCYCDKVTGHQEYGLGWCPLPQKEPALSAGMPLPAGVARAWW